MNWLEAKGSRLCFVSIIFIYYSWNIDWSKQFEINSFKVIPAWKTNLITLINLQELYLYYRFYNNIFVIVKCWKHLLESRHVDNWWQHVVSSIVMWFYAKLWNQVPSLDHFVVQNSGDFLCWKYKEVVCFYASNLRQ